MTKWKCYRKHCYDMQSVCMAEKFVLFHNTRFRFGLAYHEYICPHCGVRRYWFIS